MHHNITVVSDEKVEALDYKSSIPINLHSDKDNDTIAAFEMLEHYIIIKCIVCTNSHFQCFKIQLKGF